MARPISDVFQINKRDLTSLPPVRLEKGFSGLLLHSLFHNTQAQCDQMAKLCLQYWAINNHEHLSNLPNYGNKISPIQNKHSKNTQRLLELYKMAKFCQSGHTVHTHVHTLFQSLASFLANPLPVTR